jgi:hypothetical protein
VSTLLHQRAELAPHLRERFGTRRWAPVDTPELLDHDGVELVLIGATADVRGELRIALDAEAERPGR